MQPLHRPKARASRPVDGFTMVEMMLVMVVMTVAVSMLASSVSSSSRLGPMQLEQARASEAARARLEFMRTTPFAELFATFNADPADDPGGPGTAPGCNFDVTRLAPQTNDIDGFAGRVRFPGDNVSLIETANDVRLGLPRDLNLNGTVESIGITDYAVLPVEILIQWESGGEQREFRMQTMFVELDS